MVNIGQNVIQWISVVKEDDAGDEFPGYKQRPVNRAKERVCVGVVIGRG